MAKLSKTDADLLIARLTSAQRVIADWISFYNGQQPHQALKMMTPDAAYAVTLRA